MAYTNGFWGKLYARDFRIELDYKIKAHLKMGYFEKLCMKEEWQRNLDLELRQTKTKETLPCERVGKTENQNKEQSQNS